MKPGKQRRRGTDARRPAIGLCNAQACGRPAGYGRSPQQRGVIAAASDEHTRSFLDVVKGLPLVPAATPGEKLGCVRGRSGKYTDQLTFSSTGLR